MNCPTCNVDIPNEEDKCIQCGYTFPKKNNYRQKNRFFFIFILLTIGVLFYLQASSPGIPAGNSSQGSHAANSDDPGLEIEIESLLQKGKINIVDFYSDYCGPCRRISPLLMKLDQQSDDIHVVKLDINRSDKRGIDWFSPLVKQYNIRSVPHFIVYDPNGKLTHEGRSAYQEVGRLLNTAGIIQD